jgi:hypothetical protein
MVVQNTLKVASNYYKELFKWEDRGEYSLGNNFWDSEDRLSAEEKHELEKQFSEEEIKFAVFMSYLKRTNLRNDSRLSLHPTISVGRRDFATCLPLTPLSSTGALSQACPGVPHNG